MLTSHRYLFSTLIAASCATNLLSSITITPQNWRLAASESGRINAVKAEAIDVSHRGSGRIHAEEAPAAIEHNESLLAHRGSGRISLEQTTL